MLARDFTFAVQYNTSWLYQQLLAFHVGLWLKPKNLLNALKTDPLILFTLPLGNRVKIKHLNSNASAFVLYLKKKKKTTLQTLTAGKKTSGNSLSFFFFMRPQNHPVTSCQVLEDTFSGFISWGTVTPWCVYSSSIMARQEDLSYNRKFWLHLWELARPSSLWVIWLP